MREYYLPLVVIILFVVLQALTVSYGTKINDAAYIATYPLSHTVISERAEQLEQDNIVKPEIRLTENIDTWMVRFKLYAVTADEMVNLMALARINPSKLQFDPHFYMYGGAYLYPLGAYYFLLQALHVIDSPSLQKLLSDSDLVDTLYSTGRTFVLLSFAASAFIFYKATRMLVSQERALLALLVYLTVPGSIMFSQELKPHWYTLLWANISLLLLVKIYKEKRIKLLHELAIAITLGLSIGSSILYLPYAALVWMALSAARYYHFVPIRMHTLIRIPLIVVCIFAVTNPYAILNTASVQHEAAVLQHWYQLKLTPTEIALFMYNSLLPGFGLIALASIGMALKEIVSPAHTLLRLAAAALLTTIIFTAALTANTHDWHINFRFAPYLLPLATLFAVYTLNANWILAIVIITVLQAAPLKLAYFDENNLAYSTRLSAGQWVETHIPANSTLCTQIVPYNTAAFDFTRYTIGAQGCHIRIEVARYLKKIQNGTEDNLLARFSPRLTAHAFPFVFSHINPHISIYAEQ